MCVLGESKKKNHFPSLQPCTHQCTILTIQKCLSINVNMRKQQHRKGSTGGETNLFKQASKLVTLQGFPVPKLLVTCHPQRLKCCRNYILNNGKFVYLHEIAFILHLRHWHLLGFYQPPGKRRRRTLERKGIYKLPAKKWQPAEHKSRRHCQEKRCALFQQLLL